MSGGVSTLSTDRVDVARPAPTGHRRLMLVGWLAVLEDDRPRREAMAASLPRDIRVIWFERAPAMNTWLDEHLASCALISLDHDLVSPSVEDDPGCGRDVADFLAARTPGPTIIVHTSNYIAAPGMMWTLEHAGWTVERVVPFSDLEWVERAWAPAVLRVLDSP